MKNLTLQLRLASLLSLILLACMAAYGQLTPVGDSYTNTAATTTNYGAQKLLDVESTQTTFIQFDLSAIPAGYTSADITKASLKLYVNAVTTAGSFNVDYVNGTWTESTLDASNAPALGTTIAASVPLITKDKNQYILVDVTTAVQAWLSGTANDGIALVANSPLNASFDSKENTTTSHPAELDIVFAAGGGSGITGINTASGSGLTGGGTSGTLNLALTACAKNQVLQYNGSSWICAAAGTGTITGVTAGTDLTGGGTSGNVTLSLNTAATNALYAQLGATNTFTTSQTVDGTITANSSGSAIVGNSTGTANSAVQGSGNSNGVFGLASSTSGIGIEAVETAATGSTFGVLGESASTSGQGVQGFATATSGNTVGVTGVAQSPAGYGVYGANTATTGNIAGVYGSAASTSGTGVEGNSTATTGTTFGVTGTAASTTGIGVYGFEASTTGSTAGVLGQSVSNAGFGVEGISPAWVGVFGRTNGSSGIGPANGAGVWGDSGAGAGLRDAPGVLGTAADNVAGTFANSSAYPTLSVYNYTASSGGEVFFAEMPSLLTNFAAAIIGDPGCGETSGNMGLQLGQTGMSGCTNYTLVGNTAGSTYVNANSGQELHLRVNNVDALRASSTGVAVVGTLSKGGGSFMIDHPLDPANKYLYHSFVESPDMKNIYDGTITTDGAGLATVTLPDWFESLNRDFRYQLTVIGQFAQAIVAGKVANNQFRIQTDKPNVEVSWQVTGIRQDAFANANRIPVEVEKAPADRGRYLYPEAIGAPATARIGYEAPPPGSEQIVHHERPNLLRGNSSPARTITLPAPPMLVLPRPIQPRPAMPHAAPLPHPAAQASKLEVNQK